MWVFYIVKHFCSNIYSFFPVKIIVVDLPELHGIIFYRNNTGFAQFYLKYFDISLSLKKKEEFLN